MKVTQIAGILNAVYGELLGGDTIPNPNYDPETSESATNPKTIANPNLFKEDLSNVVDVGYQITTSSQWGNNFDKYVGKIIDKVGLVIFRDRVYFGDTLGLRREDTEYASVVEKIRVEVGDFKLNNKWRMTSGGVLPDGTSVTSKTDYSHLFDFDEPAQVDALYFNIMDTFKMTICLPRDQMEGAFKSATDMQRFFGMIQNRITTKFEVALEALDEAAEGNFIGSKIYYNSNVVNLLKIYNAEQSKSLTAAAALEDADFLRWCVRRIKTDKKLLAKFSGKYNRDNYGTFTPSDRLKVYALTDFATAIETVLRSNTYHDNFVALSGYKEVPYWQASTSDSFDSRSSINARCVVSMSGLGKVTSDDVKDVSAKGIVFVMQDVDAVMTGSKQMDVDSLYNPDGRFYKYFYGHDMKFYNDLSENGIIYVINDETTSGTLDPAPVEYSGSITLAKGNSSGNTVVSAASIETATSYVYKVVTAPEEIGIGVAAPSGYNSLTVGAAGTGTDITAGTGKYIEVLGIKSSKVVGVALALVTSSVVK